MSKKSAFVALFVGFVFVLSTVCGDGLRFL
jgi:hypothetical protein